MLRKETVDRCPVCENKLVKKHIGLVCKNWKCCLYWKLDVGWVFHSKDFDLERFKFVKKVENNIANFENNKKWLLLKAEVLFDKQVCESCGSNVCLHVHHILPRFEYHELTFDKDNLMVLCDLCHKDIHSGDKFKYK